MDKNRPIKHLDANKKNVMCDLSLIHPKLFGDTFKEASLKLSEFQPRRETTRLPTPKFLGAILVLGKDMLLV